MTLSPLQRAKLTGSFAPIGHTTERAAHAAFRAGGPSAEQVASARVAARPVHPAVAAAYAQIARAHAPRPKLTPRESAAGFIRLAKSTLEAQAADRAVYAEFGHMMCGSVRKLAMARLALAADYRRWALRALRTPAVALAGEVV